MVWYHQPLKCESLPTACVWLVYAIIWKWPPKGPCAKGLVTSMHCHGEVMEPGEACGRSYTTRGMPLKGTLRGLLLSLSPGGQEMNRPLCPCVPIVRYCATPEPRDQSPTVSWNSLSSLEADSLKDFATEVISWLRGSHLTLSCGELVRGLSHSGRFIPIHSHISVRVKLSTTGTPTQPFSRQS